MNCARPAIPIDIVRDQRIWADSWKRWSTFTRRNAGLGALSMASSPKSITQCLGDTDLRYKFKVEILDSSFSVFTPIGGTPQSYVVDPNSDGRGHPLLSNWYPIDQPYESTGYTTIAVRRVDPTGSQLPADPPTITVSDIKVAK